MDLTQYELDVLNTLSDGKWHKSSAGSFFLHRKGLVDRRGTSQLVDEKSSGYEYQINQAGKDILNKEE